VATYAIGDLQGCFDELQDLLELIRFDPARDRLWFTGDLVNRGPQSLACLRFVRELGDAAVSVLGNHELHLLAISNGQTQYLHDGDTLDDILTAADGAELLHWLRRLPLIHRDEQSGFTMLHAGLPPQWRLEQAMEYAAEVEQALRGPDYRDYFANMYGNEPDCWSPALTGWERLRFITNCLTRIRYCSGAGVLDLQEKGVCGAPGMLPWFEIPDRKTLSQKLIFGHWAALRDQPRDYGRYNVYPLDTGCVWGGELLALRLHDGEYFRVPSRQGVGFGERAPSTPDKASLRRRRQLTEQPVVVPGKTP